MIIAINDKGEVRWDRIETLITPVTLLVSVVSLRIFSSAFLGKALSWNKALKTCAISTLMFIPFSVLTGALGIKCKMTLSKKIEDVNVKNVYLCLLSLTALTTTLTYTWLKMYQAMDVPMTLPSLVIYGMLSQALYMATRGLCYKTLDYVYDKKNYLEVHR